MLPELPRKPNVKQAVPFFLVTDMGVSCKYYVDGLGFEMTHKWIDNGKLRWCMLQLGSVSIMLQEFWKDGSHTNVPTTKVGLGVSICFICEDALEFYREVIARKVEASRPFVGNSMWVTTLLDPDGYKLEFESFTDVPEETVYSEV